MWIQCQTSSNASISRMRSSSLDKHTLSCSSESELSSSFSLRARDAVVVVVVVRRYYCPRERTSRQCRQSRAMSEAMVSESAALASAADCCCCCCRSACPSTSSRWRWSGDAAACWKAATRADWRPDGYRLRYQFVSSSSCSRWPRGEHADRVDRI